MLPIHLVFVSLNGSIWNEISSFSAPLSDTGYVNAANFHYSKLDMAGNWQYFLKEIHVLRDNLLDPGQYHQTLLMP